MWVKFMLLRGGVVTLHSPWSGRIFSVAWLWDWSKPLSTKQCNQSIFHSSIVCFVLSYFKNRHPPSLFLISRRSFLFNMQCVYLWEAEGRCIKFTYFYQVTCSILHLISKKNLYFFSVIILTIQTKICFHTNLIQGLVYSNWETKKWVRFLVYNISSWATFWRLYLQDAFYSIRDSKCVASCMHLKINSTTTEMQPSLGWNTATPPFQKKQNTAFRRRK